MFAPETKIIVIDDAKAMRKIIKTALAELNLRNIEEADDAAVALPMIEEAINSPAPFQLIISDWKMPTMKGIDLLRKIRSHEKLKDIPFLMVTAESDQKNILEAIQSGVSNFIVKPFTQDLFKEKLESVFKKHNP